MPSAETKELLTVTMENAGKLIQDAIQDHIYDAIAANHHRLATLDRTGLPGLRK